MNKSIFKQSIFLIVALLGFSFVACDDDNDGVSQLASKVKLNLKRYYNNSGATTLPLWSADSKGALIVAGDGVSEVSYASPITQGGQNGFFLFDVLASKNTPSTVISFYPSDLDVKCENGVLITNLSDSQKGEISPCLIGKTQALVNSYEGCSIDLEQFYCTMYVTARKGNYAIKSLTVVANNGENIAGQISVDVKDWTVSATINKITVTPAEPIDCRDNTQLIPVMLAPVELSKGYTVTLTDTDGKNITVTDENPLSLVSGEKIMTEESDDSFITELVFCGGNKVNMIDASLAGTNGYQNAVTWSWDATSASSILGLAASRCDHIDDCKPVANNKRLLVTSSYSWCVLLDVATKEVLFYTTQCQNAHSAELLPNNRVAVACSDGTTEAHNCIQIYDIASPNKVICKANLTSAHGVVWNNANQRLYAIGGQSMLIYQLKDWESATPSLVLEKTVTLPRAGSHDLSYVDANTLCVSGYGAYLYDIANNKFSDLSFFATSTAVKSINYNSETGEIWYTDSTIPEGTQTWSTQTIGYLTNGTLSAPTRTIKVPDLDMYKVRVRSW